MNPDYEEPWGSLPENISRGDRVVGESCTDLKGSRRGTFVKVQASNPNIAAIVDDRDGSLSFVHAGSVRLIEPPDVTIAVDFTAAELAKVTRAAEASGMTPAAFALWAAVNRAEAVVDPLRAGAA